MVYHILSTHSIWLSTRESLLTLSNFQTQEAALRSKPDIVVATPGRMIDHLRNSLSIDLDELAVLILDEADRLLELGFSAEIRELVCLMTVSFSLYGEWAFLGSFAMRIHFTLTPLIFFFSFNRF